MITLFNRFKNKEDEPTKELEVGDYVYCYAEHDISKISKIEKDKGTYCLNFDDYEYYYPIDMKNIIRSATPEEIEEYETKKDILKYNL